MESLNRSLMKVFVLHRVKFDAMGRGIGLAVMLLLVANSLGMAQLADVPMQGNKAFEAGEYANAVELYRQGLEKKPDESRLLFNLGNALSMLGDREQSLEAFQAFKQREVTPLEASMADYNIGTLLAQEDPEAAIQALKESLRKNPLDEDAKYNLEQLLQQQQQEQQNQDQQQDQNQDEQEQDQNQDQQQQQNQDQQNNDPNQDQQQNQQQDPNQQSDQQKHQQQQPSLQPREAEALLDALAQREKDLLRAMKKEATESQPKNTKDW